MREAGMSLSGVVGIVDLNADGWKDLIVGAGTGTYLFINDQSNNFSILEPVLSGSRNVPIDFNNDGNIDLITVADGRMTVYEGDGSGAMNEYSVLSLPTNRVHAFNLGDLDGDGDLDGITASFNNNRFYWMENDGSFNFSYHTLLSGTYSSRAFSTDLKDIDHDGDLDPILLSQGRSAVVILENDGNASFTQHVLPQTFSSPHFMRVDDINSDGQYDVFVGANSSGINIVKSVACSNSSLNPVLDSSSISTICASQPDSLFVFLKNDYDDQNLTFNWSHISGIYKPPKCRSCSRF